ncbi:MAG: biotin--[acetyl-CoA-carboxylase] ligase [Actinobacteria bacterium]|nr:biotin--[acetyl-CoA-carboxylase] ligase [Actinomycetota bacterium]
MTDMLSSEAVELHLRGRFGKPYLYEPECESTQQLLVDSGLPEGAVAATDHQTGGRGRLGRTWEEPAGSSVLVSVLLHPPAERRLPELSLVAALAVAETVELAVVLAAQVKWPNDVMLNRRKVAGILSELSDGTVVVGIGINVNQTRDQLPLGAPTEPASLRTATGTTYDRAVLLGSLLMRLERMYDVWLDAGLDGIYGGLGARDFLRGRRITADGEPATAVQILRDGRLEIETDSGEVKALESGEVLFAR